MNYILNIVKSKAFVLVTSMVILAASCVVPSFAYSLNNIYAIPDVSVDSSFLATLKAEDVVVLDVSPRSSPFSPYVLIDYDDLADLVFRSNQNGFNVSLEYRSNIDQYVAYADDSTLFGRRVFGCLGNVKGSVYVANASESHDISGDIHDVLMEIMLDTSWIVTRCDDFYNLLDHLCDKADSIETEIKNLGVISSRLNNIIRYLDVLADDLEADDSPLLTRLDAIKSAIENITFSAEPTDLTPVIEGITSVTTAQGEMLNSMSAFMTSFNSKFSDLDDAFGADSVMEILNGGTLSWDSASRGFTSAAAVGGTISDLRLTPAISVDGCNLGWDDDGKFIITPSSGEYLPDTLQAGSDSIAMPDSAIYEIATVANPALNSLVPEGYTQYKGFTAAGASIPLGIDAAQGVYFSGTFTPRAFSPKNPASASVLSAGGSFAVSLSRPQNSSLFTVVCKDGGATNSTFTMSAGQETSLSCTLGSTLRIGSRSYSLSTFPDTATSDFTLGGGSSLIRIYWKSVRARADGISYAFVPCKDTSGTVGLYRTSSSSSDREFIPVTSGFTVSDSDLLPETVEQQVSKPGHIVKVYRESPGEWYAVDADGTTHAFDATAAVKLDRVFPSYVYASLDDLTMLPDGSWYAFWSGDAVALSIEYQAYSKFFAYLSNQMTYNRNWLDKRLDQLSFSTGDITMSPTDLTPVITSIDAVGLNIEDLNASFNTNIGSLLDKLDIVIEGTSESVENRINVTIDASNDAHNVFYITGEDGEEQSVTEFTGDLTKASGRLLSLLYRLVFADALSTVDGDLDGFEDFFTSQGEETATQDMNAPYEEENVWLAS